MEPDKHARLGPSNHRWPHCAASVSVESQYEDVAGAAAIDGTGSHLLLELCLKHGVRAESYNNQTIGTNHHDKPNGWKVDKARCDRVQIALDYIEQRTKDLKRQGYTVKIIAERQVNPGHAFGRDDWWGTCDITIVGSKGGIVRFIEAADYKDGRGYVHHEDNTQLMSYLFGALSEYILIPGTERTPQFDVNDMDMCRMTIIQPKTEKKPIRYQECTVGYIVNEARKLNEAAKKTDAEDPDFTPDDRGGKGHCKWCKHRADCSALAEAKTEVAATKVAHTKIETLEDFIQLGMNCDHIPSEQMATLLDSEAPIMAVFKSLTAEVQLRIDRGEKVPGFAMQPGKATRKWNVDDKKIRSMLRNRKLKLDELAPRKTLTFPQVEKLACLTKEQKKNIEEQYVSSVTGPDKLTRVSYKESNKPDVDEMFGALEVVTDKPDDDKVIQGETKGLQSKTTSVELEPLEEVTF